MPSVRVVLLGNPSFIVTATVFLVVLVLGVGDVAAAGGLPSVDLGGCGIEGFDDSTTGGVAGDSGP